jgi:hypothetical protein
MRRGSAEAAGPPEIILTGSQSRPDEVWPAFSFGSGRVCSPKRTNEKAWYPSEAKGTNEEDRGEAGPTKFSPAGRSALSKTNAKRISGGGWAAGDNPDGVTKPTRRKSGRLFHFVV